MQHLKIRLSGTLIEEFDIVMIDFDNLSERKQKMYSVYRDKFFVVLDSGSDVCELKELTDREVVEIRTEDLLPLKYTVHSTGNSFKPYSLVKYNEHLWVYIETVYVRETIPFAIICCEGMINIIDEKDIIPFKKEDFFCF